MNRGNRPSHDRPWFVVEIKDRKVLRIVPWDDRPEEVSNGRLRHWRLIVADDELDAFRKVRIEEGLDDG